MQISQKSTQILYKLFNVRGPEWPRVLLLFMLPFLSNLGSIWGSTVAYAGFLQEVGGLDAFPWVIIWSSILSIVAIAVYSAFVDRIGNDKLLIAIYLITVIGLAVGVAMLQLGWGTYAYPLMYLMFLAQVAVTTSHFPTYVNGFYDTQAAKRILPVVFAGYRAGAVVAGLTMWILTSTLSSATIIIIWIFNYVAVAVLVWLMPYLLREGKSLSARIGRVLSDSSPATDKQSSPSYLEYTREGFRYTIQSKFLRWMAIGTLLLMALLPLIEYRGNEILLKLYDKPEDLANFLALLFGVANIFVLPLLLFGVNRLIARLGVGNTSLIFPAGNLLVCAGLIFAPGKVSAATTHLDRTAFRALLHTPLDGLLYNAVPLRIKGRARAFVNGLVVPVGGIVGSVLLLLLPGSSAVWWFAPLIAVLAVAYAVSAWVIRRLYSRALVKMLEQEDYSFLLSQEASDLTVVDPATLERLQNKLQQSPSPEFTIFMAQLISRVGGDKAAPILVEAVRRAPDTRTQVALVDVMVAAGMRGNEAVQLYTDFLADSDAQLRRSAIVGLERLLGPAHPQFIDIMLQTIDDPDIDVRIRALSALVHSNKFFQLTPAMIALNQLLAADDPHRRAYGVRVLGQIGYHRSVRDLLGYLSDSEDVVRLEAALAVETLSAGNLPDLVARSPQIDDLLMEKLCPLLEDPVERVRQAGLVILSRVATHDSYPALVQGLTDTSPQVRATAVDVLVQIGKSVIPVVHPLLDSPDPQLRKMAAVTLSRINRREFGPLIDTHVIGNLLLVYQNIGHLEALSTYNQYQSITILQSALREQNQKLIDEIFYLFSAVHDPDAVKTITDSLRHESMRIRANAVEALESITSPETARLIAPLFEPALTPAQMWVSGREAWDLVDPQPAATINHLICDSDVCWFRAITTYALGEIGAGLQNANKSESDQPSPSPSPPPTRKRRRPRTADLFSKLTDTDNETPSPTETPVEKSEPASTEPLSLAGIERLLATSRTDSAEDVRIAAQVAQKMMVGRYTTNLMQQKEGIVLSVIEKIIFLKEVPFFHGMTVEQLEALANACEEELFLEDTRIFEQDDSGGALYVVVSGRVGIERETKRKGSYTRLATLETHAYFGEMSLFDDSPRSASAVALQDTLVLRLRREPLIALARQYPNLSLELINVLSQRLRESNNRIAELSRSRPREIQKLFDKLD